MDLSGYLGGGDTLTAISGFGDCFYLVIGQSNAKGIDDYTGALVNPTLPIAGAPDPAESPQTAFGGSQTLNTEVWVNPALSGHLSTGFTQAQPYDVGGVANMGFELSMIRLLTTYGTKPPHIVKYAVGGSSLAADWLSGTNLAALAITFAKARQADLGGMRLGGIFWDQGEADATDSTASSNYQTNLGTLVAMFRAVFGPVPFIFKRLSSQGTQTFNSTVRTAQTNYAAGDANSVMVDSDDGFLYDNLHYETRFAQLMGDRYGLAMVLKKGQLVPPVPATTFPYFVGADAQQTLFTSGGRTQPAIKWWGGTLAGDVGILAVIGTKRNQAPQALVTASGFAHIGGFQSTDGTDHVWVDLYWCRADQTTINANGGHMPTVVLANSNHNNMGKIYVFRNCVSAGTPFDCVASSPNNAYGTACSIAGGVTVQANQLICAFSFGTAATSANDKLPSVTNASLSTLAIQKSGSGDTFTTDTTEGFITATLATGQLATAGAYSATTATYPLSTLQFNVSLSLLGTSSGSAPSMAGVTQDATSGIYCPSTLSEWQTALVAAGISNTLTPFALHLCQDTSGNAADVTTNFPLTAANSPSYANVDAGWSRKSLGFADGSTSNFNSASASLADPATTSYMSISYNALTGTPAAFSRAINRIASGASATLEAKVGTGPVSQLVAGATGYNGVQNPVAGNGFRPWVLQHDHTNSIQRVFNDLETVAASSFAALSGKAIAIGKSVATVSAPLHTNYVAWFSGAAAEITASQIRKLLVVLGWAPQTI